MSVVHEAVEDAVGDGGVADLLVPLRYRDLRGEDGGTGLIAFLADFPELATQARLTSALECAHRVRGWLSAQGRQVEVSPLAINREPLLLGYTNHRPRG